MQVWRDWLALLLGLLQSSACRRQRALARFRQCLHDRRFWAIQALIVAAEAVHWTLEASRESARVGLLYPEITYALYLVPIIYASLNFGREGAIPTAVWSALITVPNIVVWHHGVARLAESTEMLILIVLAVIIASRVDREVSARRRAEAEEAARRMSEAKYRGLFDGAAEAILLLDPQGAILEANAAAAELFERPPADLRTQNVVALIGSQQAERLLGCVTPGGMATGGELPLRSRPHDLRWLEPVCTRLTSDSDSGIALTQAIFHDVTDRHERQRGLERYAQQVLRAQEEERRRIAREVHDGSLQSMVLLLRRMDVLDEPGEGAVSPAIRAHMRELRDSAEAVADELRRVIRDLRPSILDDLGLVPAVRRLLNDLERRGNASGRLAVLGVERRLPPEVELCLFRIAQEALHNVEHHAFASHVTATLAYRDEEVCLTVADDGVGFQVTTPTISLASTGRFGIVGMQERVGLLGGKFRIASTPGRGTYVEACLPTPPQQSARPGPKKSRRVRTSQ